MHTEPIELLAPDLALEREFLAMVEEFRAYGEHHFVEKDRLVREGFSAFVECLQQAVHGNASEPPRCSYWALDSHSGDLVGQSLLRHSLSARQAEYGGHIDYRVRPSRRRQGIGARLLALTLQEAHHRGLSRVLVLCRPDNLASQGVIRRNGGIFESEISVQGHTLWRYAIDTAARTRGPRRPTPAADG